MEELRCNSADRLLDPPSKGVILEARCSSGADGGQLIAHIPCIGVGAVIRHIPVGVVSETGRTPLGEPAAGIVGGRRDGLGQIRSRKAPGYCRAISRSVIRVGQIS